MDTKSWYHPSDKEKYSSVSLLDGYHGLNRLKLWVTDPQVQGAALPRCWTRSILVVRLIHIDPTQKWGKGVKKKKNWTVIIDYFQKAEQTLRIEHLYLENKAPKIDTSQDGQDMFLHRINAVMLVLIMCPSAYPWIKFQELTKTRYYPNAIYYYCT